VKILGKVENTERFLGITLFQGVPSKQGESAAASLGSGIIMADANAIDVKKEDPCIFAVAYKKSRFYWFSKREPEESEDVLTGGRDVFNEKPTKDLQKMASAPLKLGSQVVMHTNMGDITVDLFPEECPKTVENFTTHCRNGYYDNLIFHRVIKGFMVQTGDPLGDGTGGQSIWGREFEDEFHKSLRHDRPFTVSMANAGPNSNGSQFFITTVATPWLDSKHTVFGRVVKGMDVVQAIEKVKTDKTDKPYQDVKILNVTVPKS